MGDVIEVVVYVLYGIGLIVGAIYWLRSDWQDKL
jgi:hypothetical protein